MMTSVDPYTDTVTRTFNSHNKLLTVTDPNSHVTTYGRDPRVLPHVIWRASRTLRYDLIPVSSHSCVRVLWRRSFRDPLRPYEECVH